MEPETKTTSIRFTHQKMNNLIHGLDLLHTRACEQLASVPSKCENEADLKEYYKLLINEIAEQRKELKQLLTLNTKDNGTPTT